eukprot:Skav211874  [mRNA]  locus=scaffold1431:355387:369789:+ [translate_table: standard]
MTPCPRDVPSTAEPREVRRFLQWAHGDGSFRIYNLCAERSFRAARSDEIPTGISRYQLMENGFEETVCFPSADHCPPDFAKILAFCKDVEAGKGRSGTMISALLLYAGAVLSARDALHWFGHIRGGTRAGVTIPSQIRWIAMFEMWLEGTVQLLSDPMAPGSLRYRPCAVQLMNLTANDKEQLTLKAMAGDLLGRSSPSVCGSKPDEAMEAAQAFALRQFPGPVKGAMTCCCQDGFKYVTGGEPNPGDDLRPYNISSPEMFKFILQGRHDAPKYSGLNGDILNFAIYAPKNGASSVLRMFSVSRIHGALGDNGQNYKSLSFLTEKMNIHSSLAQKRGRVSTSIPAQDPDCSNKDFGSCGNACCLVELELKQSPEKFGSWLKLHNSKATSTAMPKRAVPKVDTKPPLIKTTTGTAVQAYRENLAEAQQQVGAFLLKNHFKDSECDPNCKRGVFVVTYPLHEAVKQGNVYIAYWLLKFGANCGTLDWPFRCPAYHYAKKYGYGGEVMLRLLDRYCKYSDFTMSPRSRSPKSLNKPQYIPPPTGFEEFFAKLAADPLVVENDERLWLQVCGRRSLRR